MASGTVSLLRRHYTVSFPITLIVPAAGQEHHPLNKPTCRPSDVQRLHGEGLTQIEIARTLGTNAWTVAKVMKASGLKNNPPKPFSYLRHPKCPAETVLQLKKGGWTYPEIGRELGVTRQVVAAVFHAIRASSPDLTASIPMPKAKESSSTIHNRNLAWVKDGYWPLSPPFGFAREKETRMIVPHPVNAGIVEVLFNLCEQGQFDLKSLRHKLLELTGASLPSVVVLRVLTSPLYVGKLAWREKIYQGKHKPIISTELFEKVQAVVAMMSRP